MAFDAYPALVLNADYRPLSYYPLSLWDWQHAIKGVVEKTVAVVAEYEVEARSPSTTMKLPSVIALKTYVPPSKHVAFTRFNVFLRDRFRCQYCGGRFKAPDLTFDHVLARAKGGLTQWDNIVAACEKCNSSKDDKHMKPIRMPFKPSPHQLMAAQKMFPPNHLHETWMDYLYWDSELSDADGVSIDR